ncbi:YihY/virulence factor BrkB family protein [Rhizorhapis sp.]|uniref:YihY/virulence factor BrkB family protein n=1 Tax=Rhizorhapis sp. TaxID=1968842 RepID=UPI002B469CD7|nr:YihY/virulence factor BrkB family protein [Rhizorhapis sp.]HKR18188.1 YihY/virulence factor BrkB family protein [Rhizorhapis sp.]
MANSSPQSPEARRKRLQEVRMRVRKAIPRPGSYPFEVLKRVAVGVYNDGFIHAGNLAYLSLMTVFPFFIVAVAIAKIFGRTADGMASVGAFLQTVPPSVADVLRPPIIEALTARTGNLLWFGAIVGLWTTGSLIETLRDILRRAYGTKGGRAFWEYRLGAIGITVLSVFAVMFAFSIQVMLVGVEQIMRTLFPFADQAIAIVTATKLLPMLVVGGALYFLFLSLTPRAYKPKQFPKWPGAVLTAVWWYGTTMLLPPTLSLLGGYDLTYGSLAGVMIVLIFFFVIGLGVVIGAELNAALAEFPQEEAEAEAAMAQAKDREVSTE